MKKQYKAPYLVVESFQLDAQVAASCSADGKLSLGFNKTDCKFGDNPEKEDPTIFTGQTVFGNQCDMLIEETFDPLTGDKFCYHESVDPSQTFFNS